MAQCCHYVKATLWAAEALHVGAGVSSCCLRLSSSVVGQTLLRRSVGSFSLSIKVKCDTHKHTHTQPQSVSRCSTTERIRRAFKGLIACAEEQPWAMIKNTEMLFRHTETHWALFGEKSAAKATMNVTSNVQISEANWERYSEPQPVHGSHQNLSK